MLAVVSLALAGCASLVTSVPASELVAPIERAATSDITTLRIEAERGDTQAQLALSVALAHGLNGARINAVEAQVWRNKALAARVFTPITQYTAAFNDQPSRVNVINVPIAAVSPVQTGAIDRCIAFLKSCEFDAEACGGMNRTLQLRRLWSEARDRKRKIVLQQDASIAVGLNGLWFRL